jgi:hypothetical protein
LGGIWGDQSLVGRVFQIVEEEECNHQVYTDMVQYDYLRDFNLNFPLQFMPDISTTVGKPDWFVIPHTAVGLMFTWRSLNEYSTRYLPGFERELSDDAVFATFPKNPNVYNDSFSSGLVYFLFGGSN